MSYRILTWYPGLAIELFESEINRVAEEGYVVAQLAGTDRRITVIMAKVTGR